MTHFLRRAAGVCLFGCALLFAQEWKTSEKLPGIDLQGLTAAQKTKVLKILREQGCSCGCNMKLAECRMQDPSCSYSAGLATVIIDYIKQGKSEADAIAAASASKWGHDQNTGKVLDDAVSIPTAGSPVLGPATAPITIVEFSDFQCPYCVLATPQIDALVRTYPQQVKLIFKEYPLEIHSEAYIAASAALAAHKQGKFWPMYSSLFANHNDLTRPALLALAKGNNLDIERFEKDMDSKEIRDAIKKDVQDGDRANVEGTPTIFLNGQRYNGRIDVQDLKPLIDSELKKTITQTASANR